MDSNRRVMEGKKFGRDEYRTNYNIYSRISAIVAQRASRWLSWPQATKEK